MLTQCTAPVLLGVNVWEGTLDVKERAREIAEAGFAGAVNFPSSMHYSRPMQQILARAGRGIDMEVEQLRAVQDAGLTAMFYCATRTQARLAADAGLDMVCLNLGWNVGGVRGHRRRASLEEVATIAREVGRLVRRISPATRFLLEGGRSPRPMTWRGWWHWPISTVTSEAPPSSAFPWRVRWRNRSTGSGVPAGAAGLWTPAIAASWPGVARSVSSGAAPPRSIF
ncbi:MAG: phosphoenolpyruvate hydrolase family protein [Gammaproteobacteria bacterium]|nr:phosphoenolpyruvate hydrolase family protein [Gammaproteobacteria bacterium]